ncbi:hypothetical protein LEP1GSC193_1315 [Leptospira alstonii serovar Pingchang str. 80-412]|uniref:Uncharacterized protein n=1 Tax=Leptospira alstonii serovar Pingchang str. 80-412 TaxID=1218564 RepID=T0FVA7_9LEPT|nr:hypothetical protein LEP1GSC193_1315 [Leptospira alstonii serovar Pingchang str. 80-412]
MGYVSNQDLRFNSTTIDSLVGKKIKKRLRKLQSQSSKVPEFIAYGCPKTQSILLIKTSKFHDPFCLGESPMVNFCKNSILFTILIFFKKFATFSKL